MELAGQELCAGAWEEGDECGSLQSSSDSDSEIPPNYKGRRVSFADAFGLNLVSVKEFSCRVASAVPSDEAPDPNGPEPEEYFLCSQFTVPASASELLEKLEAQKCELESVELLHGTTTLRGIIRVLNLCYEKAVCVHTTLDGWASHFDLPAHFVPGSSDGRTDRFAFSLELAPPFPPDGARVEFCLRYETPLGTFWANNSGVNYVLLCQQRGGREGKGRQCEDANLGNKKSCLKQNSKEKPTETNAPVFFTEIVDAPQEVNVQPKSKNPEEDGSQDESSETSLVETGRHLSRKTRQRLARLAQIRDRFRRGSTGPQRDDVSAEDGRDVDGQTDEDLDERWMPSAMPRVMWDWSQRSLIRIQAETSQQSPEAETEELFTFAGTTLDSGDADELTDTAADASEISTLDGGYVVWDWSKGSWTHTQAETDWQLPQAEIKLPLTDAITGSDYSDTDGHSDTEIEPEISMPEEGRVVWDWSQRGRARIVEESPMLSHQAETEGQAEAEVYARLSSSGISTLEESSVIWDWSYRNKGHMPSDPPQQSTQAQPETEEPFRSLPHTIDSETVPDGSHESSQSVRDPSTETGNWLDADKSESIEVGLGDLEGAVGGVGIWDMETPCGAFWDADAPQTAPSESVATRSKISSGRERCGSPQDRDEVPTTWERDVTDFSARARDYLGGDFTYERGGDQRLRGAGEETFCEGQDRGLLRSHGERGGNEFKFETFVAPLYHQVFSGSRPNSQDISEGQWAGDQTSDDSDDEGKLSSTDSIGRLTAVAKSQPLFPVGTYHAPVHQPGGLGEISESAPPNLQSRHARAPKHGRGNSSLPVLETSDPAAGIMTHGRFHRAADDRAEIISDSGVANTTESGRPDEEHRELLFSAEAIKVSQISEEAETKTGAEAVRATEAPSNVNTRQALSAQDSSTISLFPLLAHTETKNDQGEIHGDGITSTPGLGEVRGNTEVEEKVFGEKKTRQEGVSRTNEEYCGKIGKLFMASDKGVTDFSDGHVEGMRMEKEVSPNEDHTASAVKKEEMNESEVSVETGNIQEESLITSEDLHEEVSSEHAEHAKEMSVEHKDIDNDKMLAEDEQLNKNISVGDKGLYGTNTNENLECETSMERSELVDVSVVDKDSDNNEALEEAEEIDDDDLLMEDEDIDNDGMFMENEDNDNHEVLLEDECIDNHQVPADHEDTHDDEISVEDEDVDFDNVDTEEVFVEDDDIDDDKVSVEDEETDDDGDYEDEMLKEYEGIDDDEADYDDADEESVDEESDRCVSVSDEEIEGDSFVENEELHGGSLRESEDFDLRDEVGLMKDVSEEYEDVDYGEVSVEEKTHKYSSVAGKEVDRDTSVEKKHLDGKHLTGNDSVIDNKTTAEGKYLGSKELDKDHDEEARSLEYGDSIDESVGKVPAGIDEVKSEMSTGKTAAIYDQQEVFLTGWKDEHHSGGIEILKEREDLEEGVGVACQGQESETFEDSKADTPGAVDVCLLTNRAEHGGKTENEGKEVWEACRDEGQQSLDVGGHPCGKNPDGDVEDDSVSTDSLTDDEMELHMRSVKLAHAQQPGRASLRNSGSTPVSGGKRSSTSRSRLQLTTLSSISESLDEDGNTMEESSCASAETTGKHEAVALPPVARVETASEAYPSSWKESFWSSHLCRGFFFSILCALFFITAYYYDFLACFALYLFSVIWLLCHGEKQRLQEANRGELGLASRSVTIGPPTGE